MSSVTDPNIDLKIYQSNKAIGGPGGIKFTVENSKGCLRTLTVHRDNNDIRGMIIELEDGEKKSVGSLIDSNPVVLNFKEAQLTNIVIFHGTSKWAPVIIKGIQINTTKGVREVYCKNFSPKDKQTLPVGSGWCAGVFGGAGEALDAMGFAMLKVPPQPGRRW